MTQFAKFHQAEREDYESRGDSSQNYDAEEFRDKVKTGEMPKGDCDRYSRHRSARVGGREHSGSDTSWPMPRLDEREGQAYGQKQAPAHQNYTGLLDLENS